MKFSVKNFFSKYGQINRKLWICSYLRKKSLTENLKSPAQYNILKYSTPDLT